MLRTIVATMCLLGLVACEEGCESTTTSPSHYSPPNNYADLDGPARVDSPDAAEVSHWSPYVGVHAFGPQHGRQQKYLLPLIESGALRGVRMDATPGGGHDAFIEWFSANGVTDFLLIFPNEFIRRPDAWEQLKALMSSRPQVKYWEIGNEVELDWPSLNNRAMTPEEYTPIFLDLHAKASREFPHQVVMPSAIHGAGEAVPFLKRMLDLGVEARANDPNIPLTHLSVHYYGPFGPFLRATKAQVERIPSVEIWITETGQDDMSKHISWVQDQYARASASIRSVRTYLYVFSGCDEYSLVYGLASACLTEPPRFSPHYDALTGGAR